MKQNMIFIKVALYCGSFGTLDEAINWPNKEHNNPVLQKPLSTSLAIIHRIGHLSSRHPQNMTNQSTTCNVEDCTHDKTIPSWLLPCTCYLPRYKCLARLRPNTLCILRAPPTYKPTFTPNPNLKVQIFESTYCNNRFLVEATNCKLDKYAILHPLLSQLA